MERYINLSAGPAKLPDNVIEKMKAEMFNYKNTGTAIFEISHRSKIFIELYTQTVNLLKETLDVPDDYHVLFIHGGSSMQFAMLPVNFSLPGKKAAYIDTGVWSTKAIVECKNVTDQVEVIASSQSNQYKNIPKLYNINLDKKYYSYLHITTNNTIYGTQYKNYPKFEGVPLIADASSDILTFKIDFDKFDMLYGSHQKNMGISGIGFAIIKDELMQRKSTTNHSLMKYSSYLKNQSMFNTPNTLGIYVTKLILDWVQQSGGIEFMAAESKKKANIIYDILDKHPDIYLPLVDKVDRSNTNIVFFLSSEKIHQKFLSDSEKHRILFVAGHRLLGGIRLSIYAGTSLKDVKLVAEFLNQFANGLK